MSYRQLSEARHSAPAEVEPGAADSHQKAWFTTEDDLHQGGASASGTYPGRWGHWPNRCWHEAIGHAQGVKLGMEGTRHWWVVRTRRGDKAGVVEQNGRLEAHEDHFRLKGAEL